MKGISVDEPDRRSSDLRVELSEESLRLAAEAADVGTWDLDLTTNVLTWSNRTKAMFGISIDASVSMMDFYAGLHPEDFEATAAAFASAIDPAIRATYDVEYRTIGKEDGLTRWVAAKGKGLFADGVCRRAIGTAIDITARKQSAMRQHFLLDLMDRLRRLTRPDEILSAAIQALGRQLRANRVGYGQAQPDGETMVLETRYVDGVEALNGVFPTDAIGAENLNAQLGGRSVAVDDVAADPRYDLTMWRAIEVRAFVSVPLVRERGLRAKLFVNYRDPHAWAADEVRLIEDVAGRIWDALERARAEEALRQLNASLERQVESRTHDRDRIWHLAPVVMVVGDVKGILLEANPAWTRVLGWSQEETIGHDVMEFVAPEDRAAAAAGMAQLFAGQSVIEYELNFLSKAGDRRRIAWTTVPEGDRLYGHGRDVTGQALAEERLRQSQKMEALGQLAGGIAHDFNNVLQAVNGGAELIGKRSNDSETVRRLASMMAETARRGASITRRLLAFAHRGELQSEAVDPIRLLVDLREVLAHTMGAGITTLLDTPGALPALLADKSQLETALLNLASNARDAMDGKGVITLGAALDTVERGHSANLATGRYVRLWVADAGCGMIPEVLKQATQPFFTTKAVGKGTGLGLAMARGFAEQSGGDLHIESTPDCGTSVSLWFPIAPEASPLLSSEGGSAAAPHARNGFASVLVVDDEPIIAEVLAEGLRTAGYRVTQALSGATALVLLDAGEAADLVVSDLSMPEMDGLEFISAVRKRRPEMPAVLLTGFADEAAAVKVEAIDEDNTTLLRKPVTVEKLAHEVEMLLNRTV
jgi:PAS domain S-box-containing protein